MRSAPVASNDATPTGSVNKCRCDRDVSMYVQLNRCCVVCVCFAQGTGWLSCYLRERQLASRIQVVTFTVNYYIAYMPSPTPPVKRVCNADDITVWISGPKIPQLESVINSYLIDVVIYPKENSTPDTHQFHTYPDITLEDTQLPLKRSPKILGVIIDQSLSFHKHYNYVTDMIDKRNNMSKALVGTSW